MSTVPACARCTPTACALFVGALLLAPPASAQERCPRSYELVQFRAFLDAVDEEYLNLEFNKAAMLLDAGQPNVPCILQVVPTRDIARYAIRRAYALELDLDENEAQRWAALAFALDPEIDWPTYVPPDHAARKMLDGYPPPQTIELEGQGFAIPQGGGVFLDGRWLAEPRAEQGVPHLLQVGDAAGELVQSEWIDGTSFPEELLGRPTSVALEVPRWYGADGRIKKAARPWSDRRLHRLESSAGFAIASGTLFASAVLARAAYDDRPTDGLFYTVNGATIGSGAAGGTSLVLLGVALLGK
jgi:hypothetical protein